MIHELLCGRSVPVIDALEVVKIRFKDVINIHRPKLFVAPLLPGFWVEVRKHTLCDEFFCGFSICLHYFWLQILDIRESDDALQKFESLETVRRRRACIDFEICGDVSPIT